MTVRRGHLGQSAMRTTISKTKTCLKSFFIVISSHTDTKIIHFQCSYSRMTVPPPPPPPGGGPPPIPKSVIERKPIETDEIGDPGKIAKTGEIFPNFEKLIKLSSF